MRTADPAVFEAIGYLACSPEIAGPPAEDVIIDIEQFRDRLRVVKNGGALKEVLTPRAAMEFLHVLIFEQSIAERPLYPILHAAYLRRRRDGHRVLLAATKGAGKSTLSLNLIDSGYDIEGDEHVFLQQADIVVRPRACRVKEGSLPYLSEKMADAILGAPCYRTYDDERTFNVDPRKLGSAWFIRSGRPDSIFILRPNHGGYSSIRPMRRSAVLEHLLSETGWREGGRGGSIAALVGLVNSARTFDLSLGEQASAIRCIETAASY